VDELDVEGILAFAERILPARVRPVGAGVARLQAAAAAAFFPEGIAYDGNRFESNRRNGTTLQLPGAV
jgi:hypothetical protein